MESRLLMDGWERDSKAMEGLLDDRRLGSYAKMINAIKRIIYGTR